MAEAEGQNNPVSNCFCHQCSVEIAPKLPDFTCPRCNSGFIEILEGGREEGDSDSEDDSTEVENIRGFLQMLAGNGSASNHAPTTQGRSDPPAGPTAGSSTSTGGLRRSTRFRNTLNPRYGRRRPALDHRQVAFAPVIQELMMQMTSSVLGPGVGAEVGIFQDGGDLSGFPMVLTSNLASNPGDYAWGRGGLDTIITQLMNQLDGTGPPPLPQEKINQIPTVKITQEQCDKNLQCTVCMEDYILDESVRKLNCGHCYHDDCIIPWLQLHGTCPVCRKALSDRGGGMISPQIQSPSIDDMFVHRGGTPQMHSPSIDDSGVYRGGGMISSQIQSSSRDDRNGTSSRTTPRGTARGVTGSSNIPPSAPAPNTRRTRNNSNWNLTEDDLD